MSVEPGATRAALALDIDPANHPTKRQLRWISDYEKGSPSVTVENYVDLVNGTATVGKPNNGRPGPRLIHGGVTGQSYGTFTDPKITRMKCKDV